MARKEHNIHYIYKTTCNVTGRYYVGMHSTSNENDGYMGSGTILRRSIRKYGVSEHTKEILEYCESRELLIEAEKLAITDSMVLDKNCMNLKQGGTGGFCDTEHMRKAQKSGNESFINRLKNDEVFRNKNSKRVADLLKKTHSESKINYNTFEGKTHSDESKKLMSEKAKERLGETNSQYGTCWITKDGLNKKVKKEEIDIWTNEGWEKGRL